MAMWMRGMVRSRGSTREAGSIDNPLVHSLIVVFLTLLLCARVWDRSPLESQQVSGSPYDFVSSGLLVAMLL